jgi:hypothetical protein
MKSFKAKEGSSDPPAPGRSGERDFHGEKRSNASHVSTTDAFRQTEESVPRPSRLRRRNFSGLPTIDAAVKWHRLIVSPSTTDGDLHELLSSRAGARRTPRPRFPFRRRARPRRPSEQLWRQQFSPTPYVGSPSQLLDRLLISGPSALRSLAGRQVPFATHLTTISKGPAWRHRDQSKTVECPMNSSHRLLVPDV